MKFSHLLIASQLVLATVAFAQSNHRYDVVDAHHLPNDGSSCDPAVIAANIKIVQSVLAVNDLSETRAPLIPNCYNLPCGPTLEAAIKKHCQKAEKLAEIADLLK